MKLNQVLVVYKQVTDNGEHLSTLDSVYEELKNRGIPFDSISTKQITSHINADLVITVGGDGTVLYTSHFVEDRPILGVKSFGKKSVGFFCAALKNTFGRILEQIENGERQPKGLHRLRLKIDKKIVAEPALNDILFANFNPAATSKYKITIGKRQAAKESANP